MALSPEKAEAAEAVMDVVKTAFRWGIIPAIIYFGKKKWNGKKRERQETRDESYVLRGYRLRKTAHGKGSVCNTELYRERTERELECSWLEGRSAPAQCVAMCRGAKGQKESQQTPR